MHVSTQPWKRNKPASGSQAPTGFDTPERLSWIEDRASDPPAYNAPPVSELTMESGEVLLRRGLLSDRQLAQIRAAQTNGARLDQIAVDQGLVSEEAALRALGDEMGLDFVDLAETPVDDSLLHLFPQRLLHRQSLFPVRRDNGTLYRRHERPVRSVSARRAVGGDRPVGDAGAGQRAEIAKLIKTHLGVGSETVEGLMATADERVELLGEIETDGSELSEMAQEASVVRLVNEILLEAIESRASDVHIESQAAGLVIRYRIDGMLQSQPVPPEINRFQAAIISRLKIMARLNIAEKRLPQDGRMQAEGRRPRDRRPRVGDPDDPRRRHRDAYSGQGAHEVRPPQRSAWSRTCTRRFAS